jgi:plastocyanin
MAFTMRSATVMNASVAKPESRVRCVAPVASLQSRVAKVAKAAGISIATVGFALSASAATVKLGGDGGALVFDPASISIKAGESVEWVNNVGFPHNIVFDEDDIPSGASAEALSHEDYLNAPGEKVSSKFSTPGKYSYYCEPHQGAGMKGTITVN